MSAADCALLASLLSSSALARAISNARATTWSGRLLVGIEDQQIARLTGGLLLSAQGPIPIDRFVQDLHHLVAGQDGNARIRRGLGLLLRIGRAGSDCDCAECNEHRESRAVPDIESRGEWHGRIVPQVSGSVRRVPANPGVQSPNESATIPSYAAFGISGFARAKLNRGGSRARSAGARHHFDDTALDAIDGVRRGREARRHLEVTGIVGSDGRGASRPANSAAIASAHCFAWLLALEAERGIGSAMQASPSTCTALTSEDSNTWIDPGTSHGRNIDPTQRELARRLRRNNVWPPPPGAPAAV